MPKNYRIGELAQLLSVSVETIRYYEKERLLGKPARSDGNYRLYSAAERERLAFILNCRALDMTHGEIRQLLALKDAPERGCADVNVVLDEHIEHVAGRLRALRELQAELKTIRAQCVGLHTSQPCEILVELAKPAKPRKFRARSPAHAARHGL